MTPEAIQIIGQLREAFYSSFASVLDRPFHITKGSSYSSNTPKISWADNYQQANYVCIYAHMAPDVILPDRPLILRLGVNQGLGLETSKRRQANPQLGLKLLQFELTSLPDEIQKFAPWLADLFNAYVPGSDLSIDPPIGLNCRTLRELRCYGAWTHKAEQLSADALCDYSTAEIG